jgi:predicted DNA-binding protein (MmcQ/YjbR family)
MHIEDIRDFAFSLGEVEETTPFGPDVLVYKTKSKMFLLLPLDADQLQFNVKCEPDKAIQLRDEYPNAILPGYHMNKKHWNTVVANGELKDTQLKEFIQDSYCLIREK